MSNRTLTKAVRVRLTPEMEQALKVYAERNERSVGFIVRRAIRDLLDKQEKETL